MTTEMLRHCRLGLIAACVSCAACSGCTSVITSAYLRDAWLDSVERPAADTEAADDPVEEDRPAGAGRREAAPPRDAVRAADGADRDGREPEAAPLSLDDAVAVAEAQLATTGGLSADARSTLVTMLEATPPQDWPVVVEEFAIALVASRKLAAAAPPPAVAAPVVPAAAAAPPEAPAGSASVADSSSVPPPAAPVAAAVVPVVAGAAAASQQGEAPADAGRELAVANVCFASRVRAWGVVDRFPADRFAPGQQVILYFELDHVESQESAAGHTTRVDTRLVLRGADGGVLHEWTFDPLEETCLSRRRDYFARYVLALPNELPAGRCRLDLKVEDLCSGRTAATSLPLEVVPR
jgi:hypothetical protein